MLDEMKEPRRSKQSGTKKKKRRRVADSDSESSDYSPKKLSPRKPKKKRRRVADSDSESSDYSPKTTRQKVRKRSSVYKGAYLETKEIESEKKASSGLDVFEFDEYDGFDDIMPKWNSYRQSGNQLESGNDGSKPTYDSTIEDDEFDLPLSEFTKKHRSSSNKPSTSQEKNGVLKAMADKNKQISSKEVNETESDTVMESKSNRRIETVKKVENVKKVKENESSIKHGSGGTEKQILREKIKNMLLDAGWTIDYRPRKNKNYLDAIYTNPSGTAIWSIIKAYELLQKEEKDNNSRNFSSLPVGKLAKQTQKKRERKLKTKRKEDTDSDYESELNSSRKARKSRRSTLLVRNSNKVSENDGFSPYSGKRTILSWLIDSGVVNTNEHVEYMNDRKTRTLQNGWITRDGIRCGCCNKIVTILKFEQHSGSKVFNPFANMFLESGKSLLECEIDAWNKLGELEKIGFYSVDVDGDDPNDDTCTVCGDGGDLICCDGCPSTFHQTCLDIEMLPEGDWLCPNCSCKYCETEDSLLTCHLCYKKYHESCRPENMEPNSLNLSFCGHKCHEVYIQLQKLIGKKHELESGFSWSLIHRSDSLTDGQISQKVESNAMLAIAMSVMDECFLPFTDKRSGINLIRNVVFNCGSNLHRLNYSGFYTAILEKEDEIVCAASIRIHGTQVAEMPFIGTRHIYRRQGMCRRLLSAIESALSGLQVDKLIIPAVAEHMNTWTDVFGFQSLKESHKQEMKSMNLLVFPGTDMLQKPLLKEDKKTVELDDCVLSKKSELEFNDETAPTDSCMNDASKETLSVIKDERPCEPEQQQPGMESDSVHSHSDSKVDENSIQNGDGINSKEGLCRIERNRKENESGIPDPEVTNDSNGLHLCNNSLSKNLELISSNTVEITDKTGITDSGSQELGVPLESDSVVKVEICCQPELQLPRTESDSIRLHSDSKVDEIVQNCNGTNSLPNDTTQLLKKESFSSMDVQTVDNNNVELDDHSTKKSELVSSNVVEFSDRTGIIDPELQLPGKESDSIHSHSDSRVDEIAEQDCNETNSKESSIGNKMNTNEKERGTDSDSELELPGKESDSVHSHSNSKADEIDVQNGSVTDPTDKKTVEVDDNVLSKKSELEFNDETAPTDSCMNDASKETLSVIKDERPCEPEHQQPGKESDSVHSHSNSKVDENSIQNGDGIKSKEGLYGIERNRKEKENESGIPDSEVTNDSNGLHLCNNSLSKKLELISSNMVEITDKTGITDSGSQELGVPLESDSTVKIEICCQPELQMPRTESDSIRLPSDSKVDEIMQNCNGTNSLPNDTIQLLKKESFSSMDVQIVGNNNIELDDHSSVSEKSELISCNVEFSDKTGIIDSGSQEFGVSLDVIKETLPIDSPVKDENPCDQDSDSIHSHSDSRVNDVGEHDCNETNSKESSLGNKMNTNEKEKGTDSDSELELPGKESDSSYSHSDSKVHDIDVQNGSVTDPTGNKTMEVSALSTKKVEFNDKNALTDSSCEESGTPLDEGCSLHASKENLPGKDKGFCELPGKESDSIHLHSDSKVDEIDMQNDIGTSPLHAAILSDNPSESHELQLPERELDSIQSHSDSNGNGTNHLPVQVHDSLHDAIPSDIQCESHESEPKLQKPGTESDSVHSHSDSKVDGIAMQNGNRNPEKEFVKDDIQFFEGKEGSCERERGIPEVIADSGDGNSLNGLLSDVS